MEVTVPTIVVVAAAFLATFGLLLLKTRGEAEGVAELAIGRVARVHLFYIASYFVLSIVFLVTTEFS